MRLFGSNKSTTTSRDIATSPRYPRSPLWCKSPQNEEKWGSSRKGDSRGNPYVSGISPSDSEEHRKNPYSLTRVITAQGYNSDDSDAELEKAPSRYDLTENQQDDMGWDDISIDRYSQIAKRLAAMSDDSDSVRPMWRSFDDYEDVDVAAAAQEEELIDPFLIDPNDRDWEDTRRQDRSSQVETRDEPFQEAARKKPVRKIARNMASMVDHVDEVDSYEDEDSSSFSNSLMNSETTEEDQAYLTTTRTEDLDEKKQEYEEPPTSSRKQVKVVEHKQTQVDPPTPRRVADVSSRASSSKMPAATMQAKIIQQVTEELQRKKMADQKDGRAEVVLQKKGKKEKSRNKTASSPRGFGLFRRSSKRSTKVQAAREEDRDDHPPLRPSSRKPEAKSTAGDSDDFEDYLDNFHAEEQRLSVPTHTSAPSPRGILKNASFSVVPPTVDTGADSNNPTTDTFDKDQFDEGDAFCGIFSNVIGHEGDKTVDGSKSETFTEYTEQSKSLFAEACGEKNAKNLADLCGKDNPENMQTGDKADDDIPKTISPVKRTKKAAIKTVRMQPSSYAEEAKDLIADNRSVTEDAVVSIDSEYAQLDKNEPILVTCLRDNHMPGAAHFLMSGVRRVDAFGCQQNYEFLNEALQAENPKVDQAVTSGSSSVVEAGTLLLDDKNTQRRMRRTPKQQGNGRDMFFDELPIKTIEIPSSAIFEDDAASAACSSLGGRRKTGLFVDTQLEQDMQQMQEELDRNDRKKKKSLFSRVIRAKQRRDKNDH